MDPLDETERDLLRFVRRILTSVALVVASPFLMLAFLFLLLGKPALWSLIPLGIALMLYAAAFVVWLVVRSRLRGIADLARR